MENSGDIFSSAVLLGMYYQMLRIRRVEEKLAELFRAGLIAAPVHLSVGQEASAVGVMAALEKQDRIVSTHRCHAHYLARGGDLKKMIAEILGKETGCCRGRGGTMHLFDDAVGHVISSPIVGSSIAFAVGIALSAQLKDEEKVAVTFFGDGAVEEGIFWESINFAAVRRLPVVFVCENNLYATHSPILRRQPYEDIAPRVAPHGLRAYSIDDGNDVVRVLGMAQDVVGAARLGTPGFLEVKTYRVREHWGVGEDWDLGYRSREEGEGWLERCPLKQLGARLRALNVPESVFESAEKRISEEIAEAVAFALESPAPSSLGVL